jgi:hypothetical protein
MKHIQLSFLNSIPLCLAMILSSTAVAQQASATKSAAEPKSAGKSIFDGKSLAGWSGLKDNWRVEDEAITGENFEASPIKNNTFLVYERPVSDFELQCEFKITGGNSGIQYRSKLIDKDNFIVGGYQADIDSQKRFMGINYEERGRGILAERSEIVDVSSEGAKSRVGSCGDTNELISRVKIDDWNRYRIVAKGTKLQHYINDILMSEVNDSESSKAAKEGVLALQLHAGPKMKIQFRKLILAE